MPIISPPPPRHAVDENEDGITITLPSKRQWFYFPFYLLWVLLGILIGIVPIYFLAGIIWVSFSGGNGANSSTPASSSPPTTLLILALFLFVFLLCWLIFFVTGGYSILWRVSGKEIVIVRPDSLTIQRRVIGLKQERAYIASEIRDLRVHFGGYGCWKYLDITVALREFLKQDGSIAFDYGASTVQFASDINDAEAKQIIAKIQQFPVYTKR